MFSTFRQRTIAVYHFLKLRKPHLGAFVFLSVLFLAGYFLMGVYASSTGHLSMFRPSAALADKHETSTMLSGLGEILTGWASGILLAAANLMIQLAIWCLSFIIQIAGYNGYLSSTAVNIGWVMVRDITNMFFVVVLLLVAFGTILGLEQYEWKKMLVKFFLAAVLVNFSRIICGVIIDIGQVVMITFVNGIAATADGNLINALSMDKIASISGSTPSTSVVDKKDIFIASLGALVFASITLAMMMVFVFMLLSRMIVLWILIVLSPFAFVLSVIPQTQKYASQWWSEFGNHVIVGPAVVFFLWLSFAVVGGGQINTEISNNSAVSEANKTPTTDGKNMAGIGALMDWNKMSNFAIAIGILLVGAKTSQSLGTVGGSAMSKATDFGKKVAMVASGAAAGMWAGSKAMEGAKATGKWAAMSVPAVGGNAWVRRGKKIKAGVEGRLEKMGSWRNEKAKGFEESTKKILQAEEAEKQRLGVRTLTDEQKKQARINSGVGEGGAVGRFFKRRLADVVETGSRADKKVKDREETVEALKKIKDSNMSTSGTEVGIEKQYQLARVAEEEKRSSEKKKDKMGAAQAGIVKEGMTAMKAAKDALANASAGSEEEKKANADIKKAQGHVSMVSATTKVKADISVSGYTTLSNDLVNDVQKGKIGDQAARARLKETTSTNRGEATRFWHDLKTLMSGGDDVKAFVQSYVDREEWSHSTADARSVLVSENMTDHALHSTHDVSTDHVKAALVSAGSGQSMSGLNSAEQDQAKSLGQEITNAEGEQAILNASIANLTAAISALSASSVDGQKNKQYELLKDIESGEGKVVKLKADLATATTPEEKTRITSEIGREEAENKKNQAELESIPNDLQKLDPNDDKQIELLTQLVEAQKTSSVAERDSIFAAINSNKDFSVPLDKIFGVTSVDKNTRQITTENSKEGVRRMLASMKASKEIKKKETERETAKDGLKVPTKRITDAIIKGMELRIRGISKTDPAMASAYFKAKKDRATNLQTTAQGRLDEQVANKVIWDQRGFRDLGETANGAAVSKVASRFKGIEREQLVAMFEASSQIVGAKWDHKKNGGTYTEKDQLSDQIDALGLLSALHAGGYTDDATVKLDGVTKTSTSAGNDGMNKFYLTVGKQFEQMKKITKANSSFSPSIKVSALADSGPAKKDQFKAILSKVASKLGSGTDSQTLLNTLGRGDGKDVDVLKHITDLLREDGDARDKLRELELDGEQLMGVMKHLSLDLTNRTKLDIK